ncbi:hypothetical protein ACH5RR_023143 [Cinchona calisaya]|uniref:Uncharacterized protein n=1 Tax=Cinchona calisaya TaxID=153742 RepID=A0ABD2Z9U0_9GENT
MNMFTKIAPLETTIGACTNLEGLQMKTLKSKVNGEKSRNSNFQWKKVWNSNEDKSANQKELVEKDPGNWLEQSNLILIGILETSKVKIQDTPESSKDTDQEVIQISVEANSKDHNQR